MSNSSWPSWASGFFSPIFSQPPPPYGPRLSKPYHKRSAGSLRKPLYPWHFSLHPRSQDSIPRCEHRISVDPLTNRTLVLPTRCDEASWKSARGSRMLRGSIWLGATLSEETEGPRPPSSSAEWLLPTPQGLVLRVKSVPWGRGTEGGNGLQGHTSSGESRPPRPCWYLHS